MPSDLRVIKHLRSLAAGRTKFKQRKGKEYFDETVSESDRKDVHGGYCHGACSTWLRISLSSDSNAVAFSHKNPALVSMMANTQVAWDRLSGQSKEILHEFTQEKARKWFSEAVFGKMLAVERWLQGLGCDAKFEIVLPPGASKIKWVPREGVKLAHSHLEIQRTVDAVLKTVPYEGEKDAIATVKSKLPGKLNTLREASEGEYTKRLWRFIEPSLSAAGTGQHFNTMLPVVACKGRTGRIRDFLCEAVAEPSLVDGRGLLITFMCGESEGPATIEKPAGHAIAVLKGTKGEYLLFDPNLGVYSLGGLQELLAALIILLSDGYDKRVVVRGDDWIIFAKTDHLVPRTLTDDGTLLNAAHLHYEKAIGSLTSYLEKQSKEAYEILGLYVDAIANIEALGKESEAILDQLKKLSYDTKEYNSVDAENGRVYKAYQSALKKEIELRPGARDHCKSIRLPRAAELDKAELKRFASTTGDISNTGLAELYRFLASNV
jgi:hypothetical protein